MDRKTSKARSPKSGSAAGPSPHGAENCTCFNLRKAARAVTQYYDAALQPSGIKATQFSVLSVAKRLGPVLVGRLAEELVMDRTTLTRNLRPLERHGLIRLEPGHDRRSRMVVLTPAGRAALRAARPPWRRAQDRMVEDLGRREWAELLRNLSDTVSAVRGR